MSIYSFVTISSEQKTHYKEPVESVR